MMYGLFCVRVRVLVCFFALLVFVCFAYFLLWCCVVFFFFFFFFFSVLVCLCVHVLRLCVLV